MKTKITRLSRGKKTIVLIGASHVGSKVYYDRLQKELDCFDEGSVLYEGVNSSLEQRSKFRKKLSFLASILDLEVQTKIVYRKGWTNSDLSLDIINAAKGKKLEFPLDKNFKESLSENKKIAKGIFKLLFKLMPLILFFRKDDAVHITLRNGKVLIDCFEKMITKDEIVIFYGEGHNKEFINFFEKVGFKKKKL